MEQWILWTFLLALTAFILAVICLAQRNNSSDEENPKGHVALRSINKLASELGYELHQYNSIDDTTVFPKHYSNYPSIENIKKDRTPARSGELFSLQQDFVALLEYLNVEFTQGERKLVKKAKK